MMHMFIVTYQWAIHKSYVGWPNMPYYVTIEITYIIIDKHLRTVPFYGARDMRDTIVSYLCTYLFVIVSPSTHRICSVKHQIVNAIAF